MKYGRKQDLVTMRIPRHIRDSLKGLADKEMRTMVAQLEYLIEKAKGSDNG